MRCLECGVEIDEINESQPVCPSCGTVPGGQGDCADYCALLEDAAAISSAPLDHEEDQNAGLDFDEPFDPIRMPADLQEAGDDAEALLQAIGYAAFALPEGFRLFQLLTEWVM